jgi:hypothetical protein
MLPAMFALPTEVSLRQALILICHRTNVRRMLVRMSPNQRSQPKESQPSGSQTTGTQRNPLETQPEFQRFPTYFLMAVVWKRDVSKQRYQQTKRL